MTGAFFQRQLRAHAPLLVAVAVALVLFEGMVLLVVAAMDAGPGLEQLLRTFLPPAMQQLVFEQFGLASFASSVAFGFQHPLVLISSIALVIMVTTIPAAERESGLLDLLLARPVPRARYLAAHVLLLLVVAVVCPLVLVAAAAAGLAYVQVAGELPWYRYLPSAAALAPLLLCIGGYSLLLATLSRRRGSAVAGAVALTLVFYAYDFIATLWEPLRRWSGAGLFHYYDPVQAATGAGLPVLHPLVLLSVAALTLAAAFVAFRRQDL